MLQYKKVYLTATQKRIKQNTQIKILGRVGCGAAKWPRINILLWTNIHTNLRKPRFCLKDEATEIDPSRL